MYFWLACYRKVPYVLLFQKQILKPSSFLTFLGERSSWLKQKSYWVPQVVQVVKNLPANEEMQETQI